MSKKGYHFIGVVKTGHARYPKQWLEKNLATAPAGSRIHLEATVDGTDLIATGYKYNRRKVLCFISTKGASATVNGKAYEQRWADEFGNMCVREVARPKLCSDYFEVSPRVDNHNQSRQHDLALEELWETKDCWFRLHCTLQGICVTDAWKLTRYHVDAKDPLKGISIQAFGNRLAAFLVKYSINTASGYSVERPRLLQDVMSSQKRKLSDVYPGVSHRLVHLSSKAPSSKVPSSRAPAQLLEGGSSRKVAVKKYVQARCRWCLTHGEGQKWTSYMCEDCGTPLCAPSQKHNRDCYHLHVHCGAVEDGLLAPRRRVGSD